MNFLPLICGNKVDGYGSSSGSGRGGAGGGRIGEVRTKVLMVVIMKE